MMLFKLSLSNFVLILAVNIIRSCLNETAFLVLHALIIGPLALILIFRIRRPRGLSAEKLLSRMAGIKCGAHRAACRDAPENSITALLQCVRAGCQLVEFDVSFTCDHEAVVFHDDTVDRVTDGTGRVDHMTLAQLRQLSLLDPRGGDKTDSFTVAGVCTLEEMVVACIKHDVMFIIDVKCYDRRAVRAIVQLYSKYPRMYELAMVSTFFPQLIYLVRASDPEIVGCMAWRRYFVSHEHYSWRDGPSQPRYTWPPLHWAAVMVDTVMFSAYFSLVPSLCGLSVLLVHKDDVTAARTNQLRSSGLLVLAWTVNDLVHKAFLADYLAVAYLTDSLEDMPRHLAEMTPTIPDKSQ